MKKFLTLMLTLILVLTMTACGSKDPEVVRMRFFTGGSSGTYYAFGGNIAQHATNHAGIDVTVVSTDGSKANIESIDAGDYQLGTVQSGCRPMRRP